MKHGISFEMVDLNNQQPNRNVRESKYFWDEFYTLVSAAGFHFIEIPYEPKWDFGGRSGIPRSNRSIVTKFETPKNYLSILNRAGIKRMAGIHFDPSLFLSDNLDMYFGAFSHFASEGIDFCSEIAAEYATLTVTPAVGALRSVCPEHTPWESFTSSFLQRTVDLVNELASHAKARGVKLCLKNEYWTLLRGTRIFPFLKSLSEKVLLDLDTANLRIAGVDPVKMILESSDLIGSVHFTDTSFIDDAEYYEQPLPEFPAGRATQVFRDVGQGDIDFTAISNALETVSYTGWIILNCRQTKDFYRALLRMRYFIDNVLAEKSKELR